LITTEVFVGELENRKQKKKSTRFFERGGQGGQKWGPREKKK
jgi:hypothetical protein